MRKAVQTTRLSGAPKQQPDGKDGHCSDGLPIREQEHDQRHHRSDVSDTEGEEHALKYERELPAAPQPHAGAAYAINLTFRPGSLSAQDSDTRVQPGLTVF